MPVLAAHPGEPDGLQLLGLVRENQGKLAEAEQLFRESLASRPSQPHVQVHLGRVLAQMGKYQDAIAVLQAAARAQPDLFDAFVILAQVQFTTGALAAAEQNYRAALRLSPKSQVALLGLGVLLNKMHRPAEAESLLRTAGENTARPAPWQAKLAQNLGLALDLQGKSEEAIASWQRAIALDPTNGEAHRELNALLYRMGRGGEFLASFDEAIKHLPVTGKAERGAILLQKAGLLVDAERFDEARDCFAQVAAIAPQSAGPQNGLAVAYAGLGRFEDSIAAYEKSIRLQPDDLATKIRLASVLLQTGAARRALSLTDQVVPQMPLDQAALAVHELALRANDDPRAERLADYERHIQIFDLEPPQGFSSMTEFNAALDAHLDRLHTDLSEHVDQTLRHGTQTAPALFGSRNVLLAALRQGIEQAVGVYITRMSSSTEHPLTVAAAVADLPFPVPGRHGFRPKASTSITSTPKAGSALLLSYVLSVPDVRPRTWTAKQGWIKFGEPSFKTAMSEPRCGARFSRCRDGWFCSRLTCGTALFRSNPPRPGRPSRSTPCPRPDGHGERSLSSAEYRIRAISAAETDILPVKVTFIRHFRV